MLGKLAANCSGMFCMIFVKTKHYGMVNVITLIVVLKRLNYYTS